MKFILRNYPTVRKISPLPVGSNLGYNEVFDCFCLTGNYQFARRRFYAAAGSARAAIDRLAMSAKA
jgi:hypothetical protein